MKLASAAAALTCGLLAAASQPPRPPDLQFVFTSDAHYGLRRTSFRGAGDVDARTVNRALVAAIDALDGVSFPHDEGNGAGRPVGPIDFVAEGGDVANRAEIVDGVPIQSAARSWREFLEDYGAGLHLRDRSGRRAALYVIPGNHEASNAVGFYKPMSPASDVSALVGIYNLMVRPPRQLDAGGYDYDRDRVLTSREIDGVHLAFLHIWPDARGRAWLERDLARVPPDEPVLLFAHDEPDVEAKHFRNPVAPHGLDRARGFENLLSDTFADGPTKGSEAVVEREALAAFLAAHANVAAYFHGNSNWDQFYTWTGPHGELALPTFRVDSPMKGAVSAADETRLSFQVATVSLATRTLTVRECLWNAHPDAPAIGWGRSTTVSLGPRPPVSAFRHRSSTGGE